MTRCNRYLSYSQKTPSGQGGAVITHSPPPMRSVVQTPDLMLENW